MRSKDTEKRKGLSGPPSATPEGRGNARGKGQEGDDHKMDSRLERRVEE